MPLAYVAASTHGLADDAERIASKLGGLLPDVPDETSCSLMQPPLPILREDNWPLLTVSKGFFETLAAKGAVTAAAGAGTTAAPGKGRAGAAAAATVELDESALDGAGWGADELDLGTGGALRILMLSGHVEYIVYILLYTFYIQYICIRFKKNICI